MILDIVPSGPDALPSTVLLVTKAIANPLAKTPRCCGQDMYPVVSYGEEVIGYWCHPCDRKVRVGGVCAGEDCVRLLSTRAIRAGQTICRRCRGKAERAAKLEARKVPCAWGKCKSGQRVFKSTRYCGTDCLVAARADTRARRQMARLFRRGMTRAPQTGADGR